MKRAVPLLSALVLAAFVGAARAENTISWSSGYPKQGSQAGTILVKASIDTLDCGFIGASFGTARAWQDGLVVAEVPGPLNSEFTITGLESGISYNVTFEASATSGCITELLCTAPAKVTTP